MAVPLKYPVLMPDTPPDIVSELGKSRAMRRLKRELITGARFQQEYMILRQARINEANRIIESRRIEGLGARIARIDQEFYFQMMEQYGAECWSDPDFLEDTLKKNPGMALRVNTPFTIAVDGFRDKGDKTKGTGENRTPGRTRPRVASVPRIEHSPDPAPPEGMAA